MYDVIGVYLVDPSSVYAFGRGVLWIRLITPPSKPGCHVVHSRCSAQLSVSPSSDLDGTVLGTNDYDR